MFAVEIKLQYRKAPTLDLCEAEEAFSSHEGALFQILHYLVAVPPKIVRQPVLERYAYFFPAVYSSLLYPYPLLPSQSLDCLMGWKI